MSNVVRTLMPRLPCVLVTACTESSVSSVDRSAGPSQTRSTDHRRLPPTTPPLDTAP
jgi:hypothetical protein